MNELGLFLKSKRQELNLSLEELQEITKIQLKYLKAIENGEWDVMPGVFYTRAFIKSYAEALSLDFNVITTQYEHLFPKNANETPRMPQNQFKQGTQPKKDFNWLFKILPFLFIAMVSSVIYFAIVKYVDVGDIPYDVSHILNQLPIKEEKENISEQKSPETNVADAAYESIVTVKTTPLTKSTSPFADEKSKTEEVPTVEVASLKLLKEEGKKKYYHVTATSSIDIILDAKRGNCWIELRDLKTAEKIFYQTIKNGEQKKFSIESNDVHLVMGWPSAIDLYVNKNLIDTKNLKQSKHEYFFSKKPLTEALGE